jgi:hypothetical protein
VPRRPWVPIATGFLACLAGIAILYLWTSRVRQPPAPSPAQLPASARALLQPSRRDSLDLTVPSHGNLDYQVGMQAGATLVYAWSTAHRGDTLGYQFAGHETSDASEAHSAFVAQSSGWYRWRWKNQSSRAVTIHLKLSGYYETASIPPTEPRP